MNSWSANENAADKILTVFLALLLLHCKRKAHWLVDLKKISTVLKYESSSIGVLSDIKNSIVYYNSWYILNAFLPYTIIPHVFRTVLRNKETFQVFIIRAASVYYISRKLIYI
jgi:hypothetical protein